MITLHRLGMHPSDIVTSPAILSFPLFVSLLHEGRRPWLYLNRVETLQSLVEGRR
jgi:hypothetical protein